MVGLAGCVGLLVAALVLSGWFATTERCSRFDVAVPAYFDPQETSYWGAMARAGTDVGDVVMNPHNGPGRSRQARYTAAVAQARHAGQVVLGYVKTGYGKRERAKVRADIARYRRWYHVRDIFLDEAPTARTYLARYQGYIRDIHSAGGTAVLNPGTPPDPGYLAAADAVVVFEGAAHDYLHSPPARGRHRPAAKRWALINEAPASALPKLLAAARRRSIDAVYVTDDRLPNPWDRLPSYWNQETAATSCGD